MPRATNSPASRQRRKRVLKQAKGFRGFRSTHFRYAKDAVRKAMQTRLPIADCVVAASAPFGFSVSMLPAVLWASPTAA